MADENLDDEKVFQMFFDKKTGKVSSKLLLVVTIEHPKLGSILPSRIQEMVGQAIAVIFSASNEKVLQDVSIEMSFIKGVLTLNN